MANNAKLQEVSDKVAISIQNMNKWYGTFHVLRDIDLAIQPGEVIGIVGRSMGSWSIVPRIWAPGAISASRGLR